MTPIYMRWFKGRFSALDPALKARIRIRAFRINHLGNPNRGWKSKPRPSDDNSPHHLPRKVTVNPRIIYRLESQLSPRIIYRGESQLTPASSTVGSHSLLPASSTAGSHS
jgi:hypothetical protein